MNFISKVSTSYYNNFSNNLLNPLIQSIKKNVTLNINFSMGRCQNSQTPNWLYKTHQQIFNNQQNTWNLDKKQQSINSFYKALNKQQELYEYKEKKLSKSRVKQKISSVNYFSKEHILGRRINQYASTGFLPCEEKLDKLKRLKGEFIRGSLQACDIMSRNLIRTFIPFPPLVSNLINVALISILDPISQIAFNCISDLTAGTNISLPSSCKIQQNGITTAKQMHDLKEYLLAVSEIFLLFQQKINNLSIQEKNKIITYQNQELNIQDAYQQMAENFILAIEQIDEAIMSYKGDNYFRKYKVKQNALQGIVRSVWAASISPVSQFFNYTLGVPRFDLVLRQVFQTTVAGIDNIYAQDYARGRYIKNPKQIFTDEAIACGMHLYAQNINRQDFETITWQHIQNSNTTLCKSLVEKFNNHIYDKNKCMGLFLFDTNKIEHQINKYATSRIVAIKYNIKHKLAKLHRENAILIRRLQSMKDDINIHENRSIYFNAYNSKKNKVYSIQEIKNLISKNQNKYNNLLQEYKLFEQANIYAKQGNKHKYQQSLDILYKNYPYGYILKQLKSDFSIFIAMFKHKLINEPATWINETIFRHSHFPIFAIDNSLYELNKIGDSLLNNTSELLFHNEIAGFVANGAFFAPQVVMSMWQYQENMSLYGRPRHHELYVKIMLEKSQIILSRAEIENIRLEEKLAKPKLEKKTKILILQKKEQIKFILENLPKQRQALELFNGDTKNFINILNSTQKFEIKETEIINSIAGMAYGITSTQSNTQKIVQGLHNNALDNMQLSHKYKSGGVSFSRAIFSLKTAINSYSGKENLNQIIKQMQKNDNLHHSQNYYVNTISKVKPINIEQACLTILYSISNENIAYKNMFIAKIISLKNNLIKTLTNKTLESDIIIKQLENFLLTPQVLQYKQSIQENLNIELDILDKNNKPIYSLIDFSDTTYYTHGLDKDPYLDIEALNSKKTFSLGKCNNLSKKILIPIGQFLFEKFPRYIVTMPFNVARGISDLIIAHKATKNTRITLQKINNKLVKTNLNSKSQNYNNAESLNQILINQASLPIQYNQKDINNIEQQITLKQAQLEENNKFFKQIKLIERRFESITGGNKLNVEEKLNLTSLEKQTNSINIHFDLLFQDNYNYQNKIEYKNLQNFVINQQIEKLKTQKQLIMQVTELDEHKREQYLNAITKIKLSNQSNRSPRYKI